MKEYLLLKAAEARVELLLGILGRAYDKLAGLDRSDGEVEWEIVRECCGEKPDRCPKCGHVVVRPRPKHLDWKCDDIPSGFVKNGCGHTWKTGADPCD